MPSFISLGLAIWFVISIVVSLFVGQFIHLGNPSDETPLEPGQLFVVYGRNPCGCVVEPREYGAAITPCTVHHPEFVSEWETRVAQ